VLVNYIAPSQTTRSFVPSRSRTRVCVRVRVCVYVCHAGCVGTGMMEFGMSTTSSLDVACQYSGAGSGKLATVLAVQTGQVDSAANLEDFSQYPREKEYLWLALCYIQLTGKERIVITKYGLVRLLYARFNLNGKTHTIEELADQRKGFVVPMLQLLHSAVCQDLHAQVLLPAFAARVKADPYGDYQDSLIASIKAESAAQVVVYAGKAGAWFANHAQLGKAMADGLALPSLARGKLLLYLHDGSLDAMDAAKVNFHAARQRGMKRRAAPAAAAAAAGRRGGGSGGGARARRADGADA